MWARSFRATRVGIMGNSVASSNRHAAFDLTKKDLSLTDRPSLCLHMSDKTGSQNEPTHAAQLRLGRPSQNRMRKRIGNLNRFLGVLP